LGNLPKLNYLEVPYWMSTKEFEGALVNYVYCLPTLKTVRLGDTSILLS